MMLASQVGEILESMYPERRELVPLFIGPPGIGKTQQLYEFAKNIGVNVVTFILSNTVPSEVSGIRMPDKDTKRMEVFDDMRMASLKDGDILFLDEILEAPPMLWSACLTLIQDRIMASGRKLPDVMIVAASNKVASPSIIPASTRDRFQTIELAFDRDGWVEWFSRKHHVDETILKRITGLIAADSVGYNILTPRRVEKLYVWLKGPGDKDLKIRVISDMFDGATASALNALVAEPLQQQVFNALKDTFDFDSSIKDLSAKEMLERLQGLEEWPEIALILSNMQFDQGENVAW